MRKHERPLAEQLQQGLLSCEQKSFLLPGISHPNRREIYVLQLIDSIRRVKFIKTILERNIHESRVSGLSEMFDPIRASILYKRWGNIDEACWLVFLFVHFGKHSVSGYRYIREVYSALGTRDPWTFNNTKSDIQGFREWLNDHEGEISRGDRRGFGNHRKYQSLSAYRRNGTGDAIASYINWIEEYGGHSQLFNMAISSTDGSPEESFRWLYRTMRNVISFGRTARFDYLTMLGKLELAQIRPDSAYLHGATGPVEGASLMFQEARGERLAINELERRIGILAGHLCVGMQEMEDSLCNWQKSPDIYIRFHG